MSSDTDSTTRAETAAAIPAIGESKVAGLKENYLDAGKLGVATGEGCTGTPTASDHRPCPPVSVHSS